MKNLYTSIPVLALALTVGNGAVAQSAKPQPEKHTSRFRTMVPVGGHQRPGLELRGGANDECATAELIVVAAECAGNLATFDATDATESIEAIECNNFTSPEARDLWYSFVATSGVTNVEVEGTLTFDAVIEGFSGTCGDLQSVGCADATFPDPDAPENMSETLTMVTTVGETYYVRVYSYWAPEPVDLQFTLCIYEVTNAPANDLCTGVTPVPVAAGASVAFTGDNTNALDTEGLGSPSVWHAFTIDDCLNVKVDYCGTDPAFGNALLSVFQGCPATGGVAAASFEQETCPDGNVSIFFNYLPAGTYYYAVIKDEENGAVGAYTLNVSASVPPAGYCEATADVCDEFIASVAVGSINNTSECADGPTVDYTAQSTDISQSEVLAITVLNGPAFYASDAVTAWVDWNQNENFCEANEAHVLVSEDGGVTFNGSLVCPPDALPGPTRMRIRMAFNEVPNPCGGAEYGEVEDYTVNVLLGSGISEIAGAAWTVFPNPGNGDMTIQYGGEDAKVLIEIIDLAGRTVYAEQRQLLNGQQAQLGLAGALAHGSYTLRLNTPNGRSEQRVVVQ